MNSLIEQRQFNIYEMYVAIGLILAPIFAKIFYDIEKEHGWELNSGPKILIKSLWLGAIWLVSVWVLFIHPRTISAIKSIWLKVSFVLLAIWAAHITYSELTLTPEDKVARAERSYQAKKKAIEDAHEYELREARAQVKLAEIEAKQRALYSKTSVGNVEHDNQIAAAKAKLNSLQA